MKLAPTHLKRYKDVALLFYRYANSDVLKQGGFNEPVVEDATNTEANDLAKDLEKLGPTFVKIGQLLSTRADLLPPSYLEALSRLQDHVEPVPYEDIEKVVQEQLGVRISKAFETFERKPLGAASLGQVHLATLRGGKIVAVKVQRPGVRQQIADDLDSFAEIAEFLDNHTEFGKRYELSRILGSFRTSLMRELDYQKEAIHLGRPQNQMMVFGASE